MSNPLFILGPDDAQRVATIHASAMSDPWPPSDFRTFLNRNCLGIGISTERAPDKIVGFVMAQCVLDEAEILTIAVERDAQRQGLARQLIQALHKRLGERGTSRVMLDVAEDNLAAISLYISSGYQKDGLREKYYSRQGGPDVDAILMSKSFAL